jgi:hypothetical protein
MQTSGSDDASDVPIPAEVDANQPFRRFLKSVARGRILTQLFAFRLALISPLELREWLLPPLAATLVAFLGANLVRERGPRSLGNLLWGAAAAWIVYFSYVAFTGHVLGIAALTAFDFPKRIAAIRTSLTFASILPLVICGIAVSLCARYLELSVWWVGSNTAAPYVIVCAAREVLRKIAGVHAYSYASAQLASNAGAKQRAHSTRSCSYTPTLLSMCTLTHTHTQVHTHSRAHTV